MQEQIHKSWPKWMLFIPALFVLMLLANGYLVYQSNTHASKLVRNDYYEASLKQDDRIRNRLLPDSLGLVLALEKIDSIWEITIKDTVANRLIPPSKQWTGKLYFFCPTDNHGDKRVDLEKVESDHKWVWRIPYFYLTNGSWRIDISLTDGIFVLEKSVDYLVKI